MTTDFPPAIPEVPVSDISKAASYYTDKLGFTFDWGEDAGGIAGVSRGQSRIFLTNPPFRQMHGNVGPVLIWLNLNSKLEVDALHEEWRVAGATIISPPEDKQWQLREFTAGDLDGNLIRVFYDFHTDV